MAKGRLNRRRVIDIALTIVDAAGPAGFSDLTLAGVARSAGVAVPSLYKHVHSLADLRREVSIVAVRELADALAQAEAGRSGPEAVRELARAARSYALARPGRYAAAQAAPDPEADAALRAEGQRAVDLVAAALRGFAIPPERSVDAVRALRSAIHGFVSLELNGGFRLPHDLASSFDLLIDAVIHGLAGLAEADRSRTLGAHAAGGRIRPSAR